MLEISSTPPLPTVPPAQDFSKLGFVYITVLGLDDQVVPHTGSWCSLATAVNYLVRIAPIVYLVFQARPASPEGVQLDSDMSHDMYGYSPSRNLPSNPQGGHPQGVSYLPGPSSIYQCVEFPLPRLVGHKRHPASVRPVTTHDKSSA
ncbi:hypothetical protein DSO57_1013421 [Entomophthora muscae]|uniref:Uncharacterized protein n=1 Tax=Entomophthora muscae TaxID=34485 RepID=A0ACC2TSW8_9FUNG|nr:hypothetical protein DSO57_1013421 [Entomophthora muscae]